MNAAEEQLRLLSQIAEQITESFVVTNLDYEITFVNHAFVRLFGYTEDEIAGQTPAVLNAQPLAAEVQQDIYRTVSAGGVWRGEALNRRKDGSTFLCEFTVQPLLGAAGQPYAHFGIQRDITERRRVEEELRRHREHLEELVEQRTRELREELAEREHAENALRLSEATLRSYIEHSPHGVFVADARGNFVEVGGAACETTGYSAEELLHMNVVDLSSEASRQSAAEAFQALLVKRAVRVEKEFVRKDGTTGYWVVDATTLPDGRCLAFTTDITERRRSEEHLLFTQFAVNSASDAIFWMASDARFIYVNEAACRRLGYSQDELLALSAHDIAPDWPPETWPDHWRELEQRGSLAFETRHLRKDGSIFPVEITANLVTFGGRDFNCAIVRDISERIRAEGQLRQSEERYRDLVESTDDLITRVDGEGRFTYLNHTATRILGVPPEEAAGMSAFHFVHPDDREQTKRAFVGWVTNRVRSTTFENRQRNQKTGEVFDMLWTINLHYDAAGGATDINGIARDLTLQKQAQAKRSQLQAQLQETQKLESLGVLAGGIAHDFNNILTGLLGNAELAVAELASRSPLRPLLRDIQKAGRRAAELTNQMLAYSGKGRFVVEDIDISALVQDMSSLLQSSISKKTELSYDLCAALPAVRADATQLRQIVLNLASNASEALGAKGGLVRVKTYTSVRDRSQTHAAGFDAASPEGQLAEGRYVILEVTDSGCGMDDETKARIFDPFFTTKFTGRGLGLAAVQGIVRGHRGAILVQSGLGKGTTFEMLLPALDHRVGEVATRAKDHRPRHMTGTVLVVDDEEMVRNVVTRILKQFGLSVVIASHGAEAVELFRESPDDIDCVLLDLKMPRMDGEETLQELRRISESVPVILTSGYSEEESTKRFGDKRLAGFLQKPFAVASLRELLAEILGD